MLVDLAERRGADEVRRLAATVSLIAAAPLRPEPRRTLARALASHAAYDRAAEQFTVAAELARPRPLPPASYRFWALSLVATGMDGDADALLNGLAEPAIRHGESGGESGSDTDRAQAADAPARASALAELDPQLLLLDAVLAAPGTPRRTAAVAALARTMIGSEAAAREAGVRQVARVAAPLGSDALEALDAETRRRVRERPIFQAFEAVRGGDRPRAARLIEALDREGRRPLVDYLESRLAAEPTARREILRKVVRGGPASLAGVLAARELAETGREIPATRTGLAAVELMVRQPGELWRMDLRNSPWIDVKLSLPESPSRPYQAIPAMLTLRNASDLRLSFDAAGALPSRGVVRVVLDPSRRGGRALEPDVVELDRRLSLAPDEELRIAWRLDRGPLGALLSRQPFGSWIYNASFLADPRTLADGRLVMGPLGDRDLVRGRAVRGLASSDEAIAERAASLDGEIDGSSLDAAAAVIAALAGSGGVELEGSTRRDAAEAVGAFAAEGGELALAWAVSLIPPKQGASLDRVLELARRHESALVRCVLLERHARGPDDPSILAAIRNGEPVVKRYAQAVREAMRTAAERTENP